MSFSNPIPNPTSGSGAPWRPASKSWIAGVFLAALPVLAYVVMLARTSAGVPGTDDFHSLLGFLSDWTTHTSLDERWTLLTGQFIAHRIVFTRLVTLADYGIFGHCNLTAMQVFGWAGWLLTVGGLLASVPAVRRTPWLALPVTLLLMHPEGYSNLLSAIGMGNTWILVFVLFALLGAFSSDPRIFAFSIGLALLAPAAFANGLLVFPTAVFGLLVQRRYARAAVFGLVGLLVLGLYLHDYQAGLAAFSLTELFRKASIMTGGLVMLGRMPEAASLIAGIIILVAAAGFLTRAQLWRALPVHASFLSFLVLTVFMAALGRIGLNDYYMLQDRYRLYGLLMLAVMYLAAIEFRAPGGWGLGTAAAGMAALYCLFSYASFYSQARLLQGWLEATAMNSQFGGCFPCAIPKDWPSSCAALQRAESLGVYHLPALLSTEDRKVILALASARPADAEPFELDETDSISGYYVKPREKSSGLVQPEAPEFAVMISAGRPIILPAAVFRARFGELLPRCSFQSDRYGLILPSPLYTPGKHAVYGMTRRDHGRLDVAFSCWLTCP